MRYYRMNFRTRLYQSLLLLILMSMCSCSLPEASAVSTASPVSAVPPVPTVFSPVHPNLYLNQSEIDELKAHIAADQEPWKSAYNTFISKANQDLSLPLGSVTDDGGGHVWKTDAPYLTDGVYNPFAHRGDYLLGDKIADAILDLGLAYQLTGNSEYADKAIQLIEVWFIDESTLLSAGTGSGNEIEMWITMPAAFYGIDLLWNYPGFPDSDKSALQSWAQVSANRLRTLQRENNWENWRLVYLMTLAHTANDKGAMDYAIDQWKSITEFQIDEKGFMAKELGRTRSLDYSIFALNAMMQGAEIARHYGVDLYGYRNSHNQGLETVFDAYVPYLLDPASWSYEQISPYDATGVFVYEIAYSRYGRKETYKSVINEYQRPLHDIRSMGHVTLAFGSSFEDLLPSPAPPLP